MKRVFGAVLCVLFVFIACKNRADSDAEQKKGKTTKSKTEIKSSSTNIVSMSVTSGKETRNFAINNSKDATAILTLPCDHTFDLTAMTLKIAVSKGAKVSPSSEEAQDFSGGKVVQYTVTAEDGTTKVYKVKVNVLPQRKDLQVASITICEKQVVENKVIVGEDVANLTKKDVKILFTGEMTPTEFSMNKVKLVLNQKGSTDTVQFSTEANDAWKAWKSGVIIVQRGGVQNPYSNKNQISTFKVGDAEGVIDETSSPKTIKCIVPDGTDLSRVVPVFTFPAGVVVSPKPGEAVDFTASRTTPVKYTVKAEDGTQAVYYVSVMFKKSDQAKIGKISVGGAEIAVGEADDTIVLEVERTTDLTRIKPVVEVSEGATYSPKTTQNFSDSVANPINYTVTAENGKSTKTYKLTIKYKPSSLAKITSFKVGEVEGVIDEANHTIKVEVANGTDLTQIQPTIVVAEDGTVSPTSGTKTNFSASTPVDYVVTSQDEKTTATYKVTIVCKKSNVTKITSFKVGDKVGVIDETNHTIEVVMPRTTNLAEVEPVIVVAEGGTVNPASGAKTDFSNSVTSPVDYVVTAADGKTKQTYKVVVRWQSNEAKIKKFIVGTVEKIVGDSDTSIELEVEKTVNLTSIKPTMELSKGASFAPDTAQNFSTSVATPIVYTVTAEDGTTKSYNVTIKHKKSNKAEITSFTVQTVSGSPAPRVSSDDSLPKKNFLVKVFYQTVNINAVVPIMTCSEGATVVPAPTAPQNFSNGQKVTYTVTSEDGNVTNEYEVQVLQFPPQHKIKVHEEPTKKIENVLKVYLPPTKTTVQGSDLKVYSGSDTSPSYVPASQISLGYPTSNTSVSTVNLDPTGDTSFYIILDKGPGFIRVAFKVVVTRTPLPATP